MAQKDRKKNQIIAIGVVGAVVVGGFIVLGSMMNGGAGGAGLPKRSNPTVDETIISDRTAAASPEMSWITSGRIQMEQLQKELEEQRKLVEQSRREAEQQAEAIRQEYDEPILQLIEKISTLETQLAEAKNRPASSGPEQTFNAAAQFPGKEHLTQDPAEIGPGSDFIERRTPTRTTPRRTGQTAGDGEGASVRSNFGQSFTLATIEQPQTEEREIRRLGSYLPAGSYAPAVVLSGADAATNVSNRDNPIPVLFRITGSAVTAALGNRQPARVNLKGCTVQGSATGDLSSERVKVRLISMTCVNRQGKSWKPKLRATWPGPARKACAGTS